jgi:hypothetical protein
MKYLLPGALITVLLLPLPLSAESLEDLLKPKGSDVTLSSEDADGAWKRVVDAFRANDMNKASQEGTRFLSANFNASAMQVMGVKVMVALAGGATVGSTFENREDQDRYKQLEQDRASITKRQGELAVIIRDNDAVINRLTLNRQRAVQQGTANYFTCVECARRIDAANTELKTLAERLEETKKASAELQRRSNVQLKPMTLQLLDALIAAGEVEAAVAIANTYIRKIGNDMDVARKQEDIVRLQEASQKAGKIVDLLKAEITPLIVAKQYWTAADHERKFLTKVETMGQDPDLVRLVKTRATLDPAGLQRYLSAGQREFHLIRAQAELDSAKASQALVQFTREYPDHPGTKELELHVTSVKTKSAEALLDKLESDFETLKRRIGPERLQVVLNRTARASTTSSTPFTKASGSSRYSEQAFVEAGIAPEDARLSVATLEGLVAGLSLLEKADLPNDQTIRLTTLKTSVLALQRSF